jgi:hypothetical protein
MSALAPAPRVRSVDDPTTYTSLGSFSCGGISDYEQEVDAIVARLHGGGVPYESLRVAEDSDTGQLMGLCLVQRRPLEPSVVEALRIRERRQRVFRQRHHRQRRLRVAADDAAYVGLISISEPWRGRRLANGGRLGSLLLGDSLKQIMRIWNGPPMPMVWAMVAPRNFASHDLFADWGFDHIVTGENHDVRYRPAGLSIQPSR